jgi:hypothetical protein
MKDYTLYRQGRAAKVRAASISDAVHQVFFLAFRDPEKEIEAVNFGMGAAEGKKFKTLVTITLIDGSEEQLYAITENKR